MAFVWVLALLLWRLMERTMRNKVREDHLVLKGWNNVDTVRPTTAMVVSKFSSVFVGIRNNRRFLFTPLDDVQLAFLHALNVPPSIFTEREMAPSE